MKVCSLCGTTIGYKPRCQIYQEFSQKTSLGTLQLLLSCWIREKASSNTLLQWQTWTSKIHTEHYRFQSSNLYYFQSTFFQFLVLCTCIEIKVFFQFGFNPPCLSNLIMSSQVWCMIPSTSKTLRLFHWSNPRMPFFFMFTRDVKTCPKRCGTFWHKRIFFTICTRFDSCLIFPFEFVNYLVKTCELQKHFFLVQREGVCKL